MSDGFEWRGENFYAVRGAEQYLCGSVVKRAGEWKWDAYAQWGRIGVFVSEAAARTRLELAVRRGSWLPLETARAMGAKARRGRPMETREAAASRVTMCMQCFEERKCVLVYLGGLEYGWVCLGCYEAMRVSPDGKDLT